MKKLILLFMLLPVVSFAQIGLNYGHGVVFNKSANGNAYFDTNVLYLDAVNNRVGIGTTTPAAKLTVQQASDANTSGLRMYNTAGSSYLDFWMNSGIGSVNFNGSSIIQITGSYVKVRKKFYIEAGQIMRNVASAIDYNPSALTSEYFISITNTDVARAVTISSEDVAEGSATRPRVIIIKDQSGNAGTNNITISLESGTIDGGANAVISTNYGVVRLYLDGTNGWTW